MTRMKTKNDGRSGTLARQTEATFPTSTDREIAAFVAKAKRSAATGRIIFAMDATMSRQPTWDRAVHLQSRMFAAIDRAASLDVQLVYFRGFRECRASRWVSDSEGLRVLMERIDCRGGHTQIRKVLTHAAKESDRARVSALVLVGDAMEERVDDLADAAGRLGMLGTRCFMFQEGRDPAAERAFREMARLSGGAYSRFDSGSADRLGELLGAVAAYSTGGLAALERHGREGRKLLEQMDR